MTAGLTWTESLAPASQIEKYQVWRAEVDEAVQPPIEEFVLLAELVVERDEFGAISNEEDIYSYTDLTADLDNFFYFYFVKAIPVQGPSSRSAVQSVEPSSLFGSLTMDADPAPTPAINITWSKPISPTITNYLVLRDIDGGGFETIATLANNVFSYNDTDLGDLPGSTFTYIVQATRPGGTRDSNSDSVTPTITAPVLSGSFDGVNNEFDLTWTASLANFGLAEYAIERRVNAGAFTEIDTVSAVTLAYTDDDPTIDRLSNSYDYRIVATDNLGVTATSNTLSFPQVSVQRVVFNSSQSWQVPAGVTEIDVLQVGGGGGTGRPIDAFEFGLPMAFAGGGGGGIVVTNGVAVTPLETLSIEVGAGGSSVFNSETDGGDSRVLRSGSPIAGTAGGGGRGPSYISNANDGRATNGSGGGGSWDHFFSTNYLPGNGNGTGGDGGSGAGTTTEIHGAGGGGGGAGANGTAAVAGSGAVRGTPGNGGNGATPSASAIGGAWGSDIGESGVFGGGGPGSNYGDTSGLNWDIGTRGTGGGAANTGGGGVPSASPTLNGIDGRSGIVVIYYLG